VFRRATRASIRISPVTRGERICDHLCLPAKQGVAEYVSWVRRLAVDGESIPESDLVRAWRSARERMDHLEREEAGWADHPRVDSLPTSVSSVATALLDDPIVRRSIGPFQARWGLLELDKVVVFQNSVDLALVDDIKKGIPASPTEEDLLNVATGLGNRLSPFNATRVSPTAFDFVSASRDLRCLGVMLLDPAQLACCRAPGRAVAAVGVYIGFALNFLSVIHVQNRFVLFNGTHRACALRSLGITHAPCLIQSVPRMEELELLKIPELVQNSSLYFRAPRPPAFKDYFDNGLRTIIRVPESRRVVHVQVAVQSSRIADCGS